MPPSFDVIALSALIAGWAVCGAAPWVVLSVATRGDAGLPYLPLSVFTGVTGGLAVPILGGTGLTGLWLSFPAAAIASTLLLAARRLSLAAHQPSRSAPAPGIPADRRE